LGFFIDNELWVDHLDATKQYLLLL